jgi:hypothetical protein
MPLTTTINDVIFLSFGTGPSPLVGDTWTPATGELVTVQDAISLTTTSDTGELAAGDTITISGRTLTVSGMDAHEALVTHSDGAGGSTTTTTKMVVLTLTDTGTGLTTSVAIFPDSTGGLPVIESIEITDTSVDGASPVILVTDFNNDDPVTLTGAPNGIVDGTGASDVIGSGYSDADGDTFDNDGSMALGYGGDDFIYGGYGDDTIDGGADNDQLFGGEGNDLMGGGTGRDSLWGDDGQDTLYGNDGDDKLIGGAGSDLLVGGEGDDLLIGDSNPGDAGGLSPEDPADPGYGNDTLVLDAGNDSAFGGSGDDEFRIFDAFGNHEITGGETGESEGDAIDATAQDADVSVVYTGDESGTISDGNATINFSEIERNYLGTGDDTVEVVTSTSGFVDGGDGFDTLVLPDPVSGDPAPVVTITSEIDNGDGTTTKSGYVDFPDGSRLEFDHFEEIICFTPGTLIDTLRGRVAVEDLAAGDKVLTRDHGYQPLAWVGRRDLDAADLARCPAAAPIRISAGALGAGLPERDLVVSPRHRMLVTGARAELMFGEREVLVTAADLLGLPGVARDAAEAVRYIHVMCDAHQIIRAEGSWTESFQPAEAVLNALDAGTRAELLALFPALEAEGFAAARPVLSGAEAATLFAA